MTPEEFGDLAVTAWANGFGIGLGFAVVMWILTTVKGGE